MSRPHTVPQTEGEIRPSRTRALKELFEYPEGKCGRYRAECKANEDICTVEIVNDKAEGFDSMDMSMNHTVTGSGAERGGLRVITKVLVKPNDARVVA